MRMFWGCYRFVMIMAIRFEQEMYTLNWSAVSSKALGVKLEIVTLSLLQCVVRGVTGYESK